MKLCSHLAGLVVALVGCWLGTTGEVHGQGSAPPSPKYSVVEFAIPPGFSLLQATALNNKGEITFWATAAAPLLDQMFIYLPAPAYGLPAGMNAIPAPNRRVYPRDINDRGVVVGSVVTVDTIPQRIRGFVWENGVFTQEFNFEDIADGTDLYSINEAGFMTGVYSVPKPGQTSRQLNRGFVRTTNDFVITNPVDPTINHTFTVAINNSNRVAGNFGMTSIVGFYERAFLWDGALTALGPQPAAEQFRLSAYDLNDSSEIVGFTTPSVGTTPQPFLWLPAPKYGLPAGVNAILSPVFNGDGIAINNSGQVATPKQLWDRGAIYAMSALLPASLDSTLGTVTAINNRGQVIGTLIGADGVINKRTVLLNPGTNDAIIVNVDTDEDDADPNDGVIDVDLNKPEKQVSLRAAIHYANSTNRPGPDTIEFNIDSPGAVTIAPGRPLPEITEPLTVDGQSQPGTGRVGLNGSQAGLAHGLQIVATNCLIRGLVINGFQKAGLAILGGHSHVIKGNILGTDADGTPGLGNRIGLLIQNSFSNIVGGTITADRNVASANLTDGICITNASAIELRANFVGTTPDGSGSLPNGEAALVAERVNGLTVGVSSLSSVLNSAKAAVIRNVNSGQIVNCLVGVNANGNASLGGTTSGLEVENSRDLTIGGTARNILGGIASVAIKVLDSTNVQVAANYIGTDRNGSVSLPVGTGIQAERSRGISLGSSALTVICATNGAVFRQISTFGTNIARILNCNFGVSAGGSTKLGDMLNGVLVERTEDLRVGSESRNVFGGIAATAITLVETTNSQVAGNFIGTDRNGNLSIPVNIGFIARKVNNIFLGATNALNLFCATNGALLTDLFGPSNAVNNCHFGLGANGLTRIGNTILGVLTERSAALALGDTGRNVFGGIASNAITLLETTNTRVAANFIGTDRSGTVSTPVGTGLFVQHARDLAIGVSNVLSVICATNGALLSDMHGLSNTLNNCFFGLGSNGSSRLGSMLNGLVAERSSGLNIGQIARNVFGGISSNAMTFQAITNLQLIANFIGTDRTGNTNIAVGTGIFADNVHNLAIGASNVLSVISATNGAILRAMGGLTNLINNCYFGLAANGSNRVGNMRFGLVAERSRSLGLGTTARNAFAFISSNAVMFNAMTNVQVFLNSIGTDLSQVTRAPIGGNGITATATRGLTLGDDLTAGLIVGGCTRNGIEVIDSPQLRVVNALVGANPAGTRSLSNILSGVKVHVSTNVALDPFSAQSYVGASTIAFNGAAGIEFTQDPVVVPHELAHVVQGNRVRNNAGDGVRVGTNVSSLLVGGTNLAGANEIVQNGGSGVCLTSPGDGVFVEINANSSNSVKAIERVFDAQNPVAPQITSAIKGSTHVQGTVSGRPNQPLRLQFYGHRPKAGAQGEGEVWLGTVQVPLNASGAGAYNSVLARTTPAGWLVSSTAADPIRGTSEFSTSRAVQLSPDADGDGMPDAWEILYPSCLNPAVRDGNGDCDGDGFTNLQEYIAHTDPTRADSALRVENLMIGPGGATLRFQGVAGRQYGLERREDLTIGSWLRVVTAMPEADGQVTLSDPNPPTGEAYYRIVAEIP